MATSPTTSNRSGKRTRRGLAATGALSLALAGGAFTVASMSTAQAATASGQYSCTVLGNTFKDAWTVSMSADLPTQVQPGAPIPAPKITAKVTTGADAADMLRSLSAKSIDKGTATADYKFGTNNRTADLTVSGTPIAIPASGPIVTNASGTGKTETAPSQPASIDVTAGNFSAALTLNGGFVANVTCVPKGGTIKLGTIAVGTPAPSTSTTTTSTTSPSPSSSTSSTSTPAPSSSSSSTSTPAPSSSTAAPVPTSDQPTTGPKIDTDYTGSKSNANILGVGFTAAGVAALAGAFAVGRRKKA